MDTNPPKSSGSNMTLIIILIVVGALIVLGVGGYFGWKYWKNKTQPKAETTTTTTTPTTTPTTTATTTPSTNSSSSSKTTIATDYVIPDSDTRVISTSELTALTPWQLKVARNEIYARHGRGFVHKDLQCYFKTKSWYTVNPNYSDTLLTTIDNKNVATILAYEQSINSPLLQKDTGC